MPAHFTGPPCPVCVERGVIPPHEAQADGQPCRQHEHEARLVGRPFVIPEAVVDAVRGIVSGYVAQDLEQWFALAAAPEPDPPKPLSVAECWERGMAALDRHPDGTKMSQVAAGLGVDGRDLTDLILARVRATMDAISSDPEPADDDPDEDREGWTRAIGNAMAALCLEMWAAGMEAGRGGRP